MSRISGKIRVRTTRAWRGYPVGTVLQPPAALRQQLIQRQIAEEVIDEIPAIEASTPMAMESAEIGEKDTQESLLPMKKHRKRKTEANDE